MARNIMIQGTMSNVGKSLITAGLLRILKQDGYRVAPFKSQNMALNAHVLKDGKLIGQAQALQAQAAGIQANEHMNPVLLKPTGMKTSEVFVQGQLTKTQTAADYYREKHELIPSIRESYEILAAEADIMVIEGAGSPSELNLKENDIANMGVASLFDSPVLIVGDINPGGIFAQLYGTFKLLKAEEQARVKGYIINKFRGDKTLLTQSLAQHEARLERPVLGIVNMLDLDFDAEDSLSTYRMSDEGLIDLAFINLPFHEEHEVLREFRLNPNVKFRTVSSALELGNPDILAMPHSSNIAATQKMLDDTGLAHALLAQSTRTLHFISDHNFTKGAIPLEFSSHFDHYSSAEKVEALITELIKKKGLSSFENLALNTHDLFEAQLNKLADEMRASLDMEALYKIIGVK